MADKQRQSSQLLVEAKFLRIIASLESSFNDLHADVENIGTRITTLDNVVGGFVHSDNGGAGFSIVPNKKRIRRGFEASERMAPLGTIFTDGFSGWISHF